jgi:hypothetical protein
MISQCDEALRLIMDAAQIENYALRYVLHHIGDAATIKVHSLSNEAGWLVEVYGQGMEEPIGHLRYSLAGALLPKASTSPAEIRWLRTKN